MGVTAWFMDLVQPQVGDRFWPNGWCSPSKAGGYVERSSRVRRKAACSRAIRRSRMECKPLRPGRKQVASRLNQIMFAAINQATCAQRWLASGAAMHPLTELSRNQIPRIQMVYPNPCKELEVPPRRTISGWDCPCSSLP